MRPERAARKVGATRTLESVAEPSTADRIDALARSMGLSFVIAGSTGMVSLIFPAAAYGSTLLAGLVSAGALIVGVALLAGLLRRQPPIAIQFVLGFATVLIALAVYASGAPSSGAMFFFLWITPYAFALSSRRQAAAQSVWVMVCSAAVLALQVHRHPGIGAPSEIAGMWFIAVATALGIGSLVRRLSRSLRDVDLRFRRAFSDSRIGAAFVSTDARWLEVNPALCRMLGPHTRGADRGVAPRHHRARRPGLHERCGRTRRARVCRG